MTGRILWERSEVGVAICSGEFGISAGLSEFTALRESIIIPGLRPRMIVAMVGLVCSDQLS